MHACMRACIRAPHLGHGDAPRHVSHEGGAHHRRQRRPETAGQQAAHGKQLHKGGREGEDDGAVQDGDGAGACRVRVRYSASRNMTARLPQAVVHTVIDEGCNWTGRQCMVSSTYDAVHVMQYTNRLPALSSPRHACGVAEEAQRRRCHRHACQPPARRQAHDRQAAAVT